MTSKEKMHIGCANCSCELSVEDKKKKCCKKYKKHGIHCKSCPKH